MQGDSDGDMNLTRTMKHRPASLWRNRNYLLLWSGQIISSTGTQVSQLAFPLLVLLLTHSVAQAGFVGAVRTIPYLLFSLPAGALLDRWDRKRVMIICDTIRLLCLASIPATFAIGRLSLTQIYLVSLIEGTLFVFFDIAQLSSLSNVVDQDQLPAAVAQNQATEGITFLIGPSLGGFLYGLNILLPFIGDALSYFVSVLSLCCIRQRFQQERAIKPRRFDHAVTEGLTWFWHHSLLRTMAVLSSGINLVIAGGSSLLIIVLVQHQHASTFVIGLIFACGGIGSILGSLFGPIVQKRFGFGATVLGNVWLLVLLWPLYIVAQNVVMLGVLTTALFFLGPIYTVVNASYRLAIVPDALQGRVNGIIRFISFTSQPIGLAATGVLLQSVGTRVTILLGGGVLLLAAGIATANKHVRQAPQMP